MKRTTTCEYLTNSSLKIQYWIFSFIFVHHNVISYWFSSFCNKFYREFTEPENLVGYNCGINIQNSLLVTLGRFHQHFYAQLLCAKIRKQKKAVKTWVSFNAIGSEKTARKMLMKWTPCKVLYIPWVNIDVEPTPLVHSLYQGPML